LESLQSSKPPACVSPMLFILFLPGGAKIK
jgi:hypothetical protein